MFMQNAYEGQEPYIFISYAHKDSNTVLPIIQGLQERGFRVWYRDRHRMAPLHRHTPEALPFLSRICLPPCGGFP